MSDKKYIKALIKLAEHNGIETSYKDAAGRERVAAIEALVRILQDMGVPLERVEDSAGALRHDKQQSWKSLCEPVTVAWDGRPAEIMLRLPVKMAETRLECSLEVEGEGLRRWRLFVDRLSTVKECSIEGIVYAVKRLILPPLAPGYHKLSIIAGGVNNNVLIISAPRRVYVDGEGGSGKKWGVFIPLYALNSSQSWGAGDFSDMDKLLRRLDRWGGDVAGTLPLLATFLEEPFEPSPYSPVSRLFWNEFYLDVTGLEEFRESREAIKLYNSGCFKEELSRLRACCQVDYRKAMALKRRVLELCAEELYSSRGRRLESMANWALQSPAVKNYAQFRAVVEKRKTGWNAWPEAMRRGVLHDGDYDRSVADYHLYVQWAASEQLGMLSRDAAARGQSLYLDLPLGVHIDGYDTWSQQEIFVAGASTGAPPDQLCPGGQDWELPPIHPRRIREQGYSYYIQCIHNHLQYAGLLRLDHVMGLHRLFWVPRGMPAGEGVYVRYRAEEFYAVLSLESHRHRSSIVGEDLGIVPEYVRRAMSRHGLMGMYVLPFEYTGDRDRALRPIPERTLSCLNTHDMMPFDSFWKEMRCNGGDSVLSTFLQKKGWLKSSAVDARKALPGCLAHLAASRSRVLLVNLEDLWLESRPQNVPGTKRECPNWRRKARYTVEDIEKQREIGTILKKIDLVRKSRKRAKRAGSAKGGIRRSRPS